MTTADVGDHSDAKRRVGDLPPHEAGRLQESYGKESRGVCQTADPRGQGQPSSASGYGAGPARYKQNGHRTQGQDTILPVEITIFSDKSFSFILKTPPAAVLLKKEAGIEKGSGQPNRNKVGKVTKAQVRKIAELKMPDLNCDTVESAMMMVAGAARSMGLEVID